MASNVVLEPIFVLHTRAYRETSMIAELFTETQGRVAVIAKGAKRARSPFRGNLRAFLPLIASWQGRSDLMTLTSLEANGDISGLGSELLACGFYLNELILRLLHSHDPHPNLFVLYSETLKALKANESPALVLRLFEKKLLDELGYGLSLVREADNAELIKADCLYELTVGQGFCFAKEDVDKRSPWLFSGKTLLDLEKGDLEDKHSLQEAKRLMRVNLAVILGDKPLQSRDLVAASFYKKTIKKTVET